MCGWTLRVAAGSWLALWITVAMGAPEAFRVDTDRTHMVIVTHPVGIGHPHLITAQDYQAELWVDETDLAQSRFSIALPVDSLGIDPPEVAAELGARLRMLGLVDGEFPRLSDAELEKTVERIRSHEQLAADLFPLISARLMRLTAGASEWGEHSFPYTAEIALTVRGRTVTRVLPANVVQRNGRLHATAVGEFRFTEFGIEPFSAALGLVRNTDVFHLYVELHGRRD